MEEKGGKRRGRRRRRRRRDRSGPHKWGDAVRTAGATCLCVRWRERVSGRRQGRKGGRRAGREGEGGERERVRGEGETVRRRRAHVLEKQGKRQITRCGFKRRSAP